MISLIGWAANKAIGWALPGLSANALYIVAGLLLVGIPSAYAWHKGVEGKSAAIATERAACELSKAEDARVSAETLAHLLDRIAKAEEDETGTAAEICARDPFCKGAKK